MFEPLFKVHTTVGMILNGFLKTTATVCVLFAAISTAPVVPDCVLLFYQIIIALLCPGKVIVTVFAFESTIPVTPSLLAPCKDSTTTTSLYCLVTRSNVSDVVLIVPNTIAVLYICKSILIDFSVISFLFALLFYDGFTDSLDGGQLIVLHDALSILLFESAIDLM